MICGRGALHKTNLTKGDKPLVVSLTEHEDATQDDPHRVEVCGLRQLPRLGFQGLQPLLQIIRVRHVA